MKELINIQKTLKASKGQFNKFGNYKYRSCEDILGYISKHFTINPQTGIIVRDDRVNSNGSFDKDGYLILKVKGKQFKAHRVAWFLYYGCFPNMEIDHINRIRTDNRKCNLREATRVENVNNSVPKINPNTGCRGIYIDRVTYGLKKVFTTRINNKTYRFNTLEEAKQFRLKNGKKID